MPGRSVSYTLHHDRTRGQKSIEASKHYYLVYTVRLPNNKTCLLIGLPRPRKDIYIDIGLHTIGKPFDLQTEAAETSRLRFTNYSLAIKLQ